MYVVINSEVEVEVEVEVGVNLLSIWNNRILPCLPPTHMPSGNVCASLPEIWITPGPHAGVPYKFYLGKPWFSQSTFVFSWNVSHYLPLLLKAGVAGCYDGTCLPVCHGLLSRQHNNIKSRTICVGRPLSNPEGSLCCSKKTITCCQNFEVMAFIN